MKCAEVLEELVAYLDGELTPDAAGQIHRHLADCPACRKEAQLLFATGNLLKQLPEAVPNAAAEEAIRNRVHIFSQTKSGQRVWPSFAIPKFRLRNGGWPRIAALAAAAGLLVALGLYLFRPATTPTVTRMTEAVKGTDNNTIPKTKLDYYQKILTSLQEVKEEDYWNKDELKTLSPYLFADAWNTD